MATKKTETEKSGKERLLQLIQSNSAETAESKQVASSKSADDVDIQKALQSYWQCIETIFLQPKTNNQKTFEKLRGACYALMLIIKQEETIEKPQLLIQGVHLLAALTSYRPADDELLLFVYKDLPRYGATPADFLAAYESLVAYTQEDGPNFLVDKNKLRVKTSKGCRPIHYIMRYWPEAGIGYQEVMETINYLREKDLTIYKLQYGQQELIQLVDDEGSSLLHLLVKHMPATNSDSVSAVMTVIKILSDTMKSLGYQHIMWWSDANRDTILHVICATWLKRGVSIDDIITMIEFLKNLGANPCAVNKQGHSPLECIVNNSPEAFSQIDRLVKALYTEENLPQLAHTDANGRNLLTAFAEEWVSYPVVRDDPLSLLKKLFELAPGLDVDAHVPGKSSPAINTICRTWLEKGVAYDAVNGVIDFLSRKGANLNLKDINGDTLILIVVKHWQIGQHVTFEQFYDALQYYFYFNLNKSKEPHVDKDGKTVLHLIFEKWGKSLQPDQLKRICEGCVMLDQAFLRDQFTRQGRSVDQTTVEMFNLVESDSKKNAVTALDLQNRTPLFYFFTHCDVAVDTKFCVGVLEDFVRNGAKLNVEDSEEISLLHLAAEYSTAFVFQYLLNKFSEDRIIYFATNPDYNKSLFAYLARNKVEPAKILTVLARALLQILPLDHTKDPGKTLWSHLSFYLAKNSTEHDYQLMVSAKDHSLYRTKNTHKTFEVLIDATVSARQLVCIGRYSGVMAYTDLALSNIVLCDLRQLTVENLLLIDSMFKTATPTDAVRVIGMPVAFTPGAREALGVLLRDTERTHTEAAKAMGQLVRLSGASVLDCVVLARCLDIGHLIPRDVEQALKFYSMLDKMPDNIGGFIENCRVFALAGIESLARKGFNAAKIYMTLYYANIKIPGQMYDELPTADAWYKLVENPSEELRAHMGKRWLEAGNADQAIKCYDYLPARLARMSQPHSIYLVKDCCSLLLSGDPSYQRQAAEGLSKNLKSLCLDTPSRVKILRTLATLVDDPDHDGEFVTELLQTLMLENLFSEEVGKPPVQSLLPSYLSFFSSVLENPSTTAYSTDIVEVYLNILVMGDYINLRERLSAKPPRADTNKWIEAVSRFITVIEGGYSPIPQEWMDTTFSDRMRELKGLCETASKERIEDKGPQ